MTVGVRGTLKAGDVEDYDIVTLDDVGYTIAILGHLKEEDTLESLSLPLPPSPLSLSPLSLSLTGPNPPPTDIFSFSLSKSSLPVC